VHRVAAAALDLTQHLLIDDVLEFAEGLHAGGDSVGGIGVACRRPHPSDDEFGGKLATGGFALPVGLMLSTLLSQQPVDLVGAERPLAMAASS